MEFILITGNKFENIRKQVLESKNKTIIFTSDEDELNRKVMEKISIDILLINQKKRKDFQKQRNSGFNHVLAKIAKENKIAIGINLDEIINSNGKEKAEILARVEQNIMLCNKNKLKMHFISIESQRDLHDLKALGSVLGMPTDMTSNLQTFFN
jgi:RNase P/RNase MRP subunit p30